jgi:hypothetical protein
VVATAGGSEGGRGGGCPFSSSFPVFFALLFFFLFLLSSSVSLLGATGGCREEEQRWRCRAEGGRRWFFFFPPSTPPLVFFLSVMFCFSSPSLVLLALAALVVAEWRCWMVVAEWLCSQWMAMPDGGSALSLLCVFFVFLLLPVSVSCSSVSSSSFFLLEDGLRWSCCGATGRNGGGGYADHSRWFFLSSPLFGFSLLCFQMFSVFSPFKTIPPPLTMSFASLIHQNFAPPLLSCNLPLYL